MGYSVKTVAEKVNLSPHVLRYYEKEGLLPHVCRSDNGFRQYSQEDLDWLGLISCLKNTGMSLKQIKAFMDLTAAGKETLPVRCEMLIAHKRNVETKMAEMQKQLDKITHKIAHFTSQYEQSVKDAQTVSDESKDMRDANAGSQAGE